jgi:transcriptional regulator with XRE-family HTH domain
MTSTDHDPAIQQRRLRLELRRIRVEQEMSQKDVAEALDWSPSKLLRIEAGDVRVSITDLRALLDHYGITDHERVAALVQLGREVRRQPRHDYADILSPEFRKYLGFERVASIIRNYEPFFIPGLLQTAQYAQAVISAVTSDGYTDAMVARGVESRVARKTIFTRTPPADIFLIFDEAALWRIVGSTAIMGEQLQTIKEIAQKQRVTVRIVPFGRGIVRGVGRPFAILEFPDLTDEPVLYTESRERETVLHDDPTEISTYLADFWKIEDLSASAEETVQIIDRVVASL